MAILTGLKRPTGQSAKSTRRGITSNRRNALFLVFLSIAVFEVATGPTVMDGSDSLKKKVPVSSVITIDETTRRLNEMGLEPIYNPLNTSDPWKAELFQRLDRIRVACGELCTMNSVEAVKKHTLSTDSQLFGRVVVPVNCPAILGCEEIDAGDRTIPSIPPELLNYFTLQKAYQVSKDPLLNNAYLGGNASMPVWTKEKIEEIVGDLSLGNAKGTYGAGMTNNIRDRLSQIDMKGKSVLVIGSQTPWLEAMCLHFGAAKVTTLEYGKIKSFHPQVFTITPDEFRTKYRLGELEEFDGVISHSSLEHSGLGRYGDALNPWGDILAVARAWCVTKSGGFMYLGLPTGHGGKDWIKANWHRNYGVLRWPLVTANWRCLDGNRKKEFKRGGLNLGFIFRKEDPPKPTQ